ncbi:hypothetical protein V6C27_05910 [Peptococcaceae bacterium 1198_IL3148]
MAILCNSKKLPINVVVKVGYDNDKYITDFTSDPPIFNVDGPNREFVIRENINLTIGFYPDTRNDHDENSYLKIETHSDNEQQENGFTIPLGNSMSVFNVSGNLAFPFRLGYTIMKLIYKDEVYLTKVPVIPIHYSYEQVIGIHNFLEQQIQNICYDHIVNEGLAEQFDRVELHWYREYGKFHYQKESEIVGLFSRINQDELRKMVKRYVTQPFPAKMDAKGFRKTLTKGVQNQGKPYFNQKTQLIVDEKNSMWLKYTLYRWFHKIEDAIVAIEKEVHTLRKDIKQHEQKIDKIILKKYQINDPNVSKIYSRALPTEIGVLRQKIEKRCKYKHDRDLWLKSLYFIKHRILYLMHETELKDVLLRPPKGDIRLQGQVLKRIQRLYKESELFAKPHGNNSRLIQVPKHTWQVFEYFVVSKTIDILSSMEYGFNVTQGLDNNIIENIIINGIPESSVFTLENDTHTIKVVYDDPLPRSEEDAKEHNHSFYTYSTHNRPDIRLELYEKEEDQLGKFLGLAVIEVKFRKFDALYNRTPTDTMVALTDYNNIMYCAETTDIFYHRHTYVDRVICVYAGSTSGKKNLEFKDCKYYIRLFPHVDDSNQITKLIGESEIRQVLEHWLQEKIQVTTRYQNPMPASG